MRSTPDDRTLSVPKVAAMCHVSSETIRRWIRNFGLVAHNTQLGMTIRVRESDLRAFAERMKVYVDWSVADDDLLWRW